MILASCSPPGGANFESAPFKLTLELLEVMDSSAERVLNEFFDYFELLCFQGFLTCRKHAGRVIILVECCRILVSHASKVVLGQ